MTSSRGCWWARARARGATWRRPRRENSGDWLLVSHREDIVCSGLLFYTPSLNMNIYSYLPIHLIFE